MLDRDNGENGIRKIHIKLLYLYLVQHMLHQKKAQQFYTNLGRHYNVLSPTEKSKI